MIDSTCTETGKIYSTINFIRKVYIGLIILEILQLITLFAGISHESNFPEILVNGCILLVDISIYYGLKEKREWVVNLVLFTSAMILIRGILIGASAASNFMGLIGHLIAFALVLFSAYQIVFFTKKEVKKIFSSSGSALF